MTEVELAEHVVAYLKTGGWEVYQEVQPGGSRIADIVATKGDDLWVIEVKTSITAALVEQAWEWRGWANFVSIAFPEAYRQVKGRHILNMFCRNNGIGMLRVRTTAWNEQRIMPLNTVGRSEVRLKGFLEVLHEAHKTFCAAGSAGGGYLTQFKLTAMAWTEYVKEHSGCTVAELVANVPHHYASKYSARTGVVSTVEQGFVKGVRIDRTRKPMQLFLRED